MKKTIGIFRSMLILAGTLLAATAAMAGTVTVNPPPVVYPGNVGLLYPTGIGFNPVVDYTKPNFAQSPNIRKFIDSLPGLGALNKNNLGQYIPVAVPDTNSYPGSDYYEIGLKQYNQQLSSDLPASGTALRGYYQKNGTDSSSKYLGPAIIAKRDRPVRVKFFNELGTGTAGDLPLPVDTTIMGAGMGPVAGQNYTQNRADLHLHGGFTPWISDGTPHQWITPAGDPTVYKKGDSFQNVPDMINASVVNGISVPCIGSGTCFSPSTGDGIGTYFYTNQQSGRLLFYHDHAYGITRLNVYAGEAAPYLIVDQVEEDLIAGTNASGGNPAAKQILPDQKGLDNNTGLYRYGIPLVLQDKAFVNDAATAASAAKGFPAPSTGYAPTPATLATDPLWQYYAGTAGGNLWFPHEYMPIENMFDPTGNTSNGRYDYAPFMNPPMVPTNLTLPSPTLVPETFVDTALVNGAAFPYLELPPQAVRFRILNASNDRSLNLQLYKADPLRINVTNGGTGYSANPTVSITGNAGTYATATATVSPGTIASIDVVGAAHYIFAPTVTLSGGGGTCTSVTATIPSNTSGILDINAVGCKGFTSAPTVTITGGGGGTYTSATATIIPPGVITGITVTGAAGYRSDQAAPTVTISDATGSGATAAAFVNTEVKMVDAAPNPAFPSWPTDGRDGGVPDPTTAGPPWLQIGNESGLLAQAAVWPQQPVVYEQTRQNIPTLGVTARTLLLMPAMRADVIVDLSGYHDGDTLILYNDSPAPMPGFWAIDDYYTDDPDLTAVGGSPTTPPGFGPNTRTFMQIRIKGTAASSFAYSQSAVQTALPKAFAASQAKPLVPQNAYNDAYPGFATFDTYAQNYFDTLNLTGTGQPIARIKTMATGNNYVTAPTVNIVGGGGTGAKATAGLNPCGGITLLTTGAGYTAPPAVTIGTPASTYTAPAVPPAGTVPVAATAVATISGGTVNAITIDEPGSYYNVNSADALAVPTCTIAPPTGCTINTTTCVQATCSSFIAVANTVGSITVSAAGSGYTSQPYVFLSGGLPGTGATAVALVNGALSFTGKNLTEGFDPDFGRMDVRLGSTPNPLTPSVGNGMVVGIARYIDPPTEFLNDGETTLWRLTHLGVDSHAIHFHLFDLQVINRVDFTNVVKPPYPDEIGWRETVRTNPMEDIIVALKPRSMALPFPMPRSNRLLDPTTPLNSTANFLPVAPPAGIAAVPQVTNVMTDYGWEYVWHCHLLGHEENDMMRPTAFQPANPVASAAPAALPFGSQGVGSASVKQTITLSNSATVGQSLFISSIGISGTNPGDFVQTNNCGSNLPLGASCTIGVTFTPGAAGARGASLTIGTDDPAHPTLTVALSGTGVAVPAAPSNLTATIASATSIALSWTDNSNNETSFAVWGSVNNGAFAQIGTVARTGANTILTGGTVTFTHTGLTTGNTYSYYVTALNGTVASAPTSTVSVLLVVPIAIDTTVTANSVTAGRTITSPSMTTKGANELLVAFVMGSSPSPSLNTTVTGITNTGGALTWTRAVITNGQPGTAEIWWAYATARMTGTVTATLSQSVASRSITVVSFTGTAAGAAAIGATGGHSSATGAPSASLVTTRANSWVFGAGNDWTLPIARTLGAGQTLVQQYLASTNDTYWVQRQTASTPAAGTTVTINDTAPTTDMSNLSIVEIRTP
jgi:FtsP/CotA-like multicopper oxidase with cupredoxin domain